MDMTGLFLYLGFLHQAARLLLAAPFGQVLIMQMAVINGPNRLGGFTWLDGPVRTDSVPSFFP